MYLVSKRSEESVDESLVYSPEIGPHQAGDLLLLVFAQAANASASPTDPGLIALNSDLTYVLGVAGNCYYKIATSSNDNVSLDLTDTRTKYSSVFVFRGVDQTTPIDVYNFFSSNTGSTSVTFPQVPVSTNTNNTLNLYVVVSQAMFQGYFDDPNLTDLDFINWASNTGATYQDVAGSVSQQVLKRGGNRHGMGFFIALRDDGTNKRGLVPKNHAIPIKRYGAYLNDHGTYNIQDASSILPSTIDNIDVVPGTASYQTTVNGYSDRTRDLTRFRVTNSVSGDELKWVAVTDNLTSSEDLSNGIISVDMLSAVGINSNWIGPKGFYFLLVDSLNNWVAFGYDRFELQETPLQQTLFFDENSVPDYASTSAMDWTDITKFGYIMQKGSRFDFNPYVSFGNIFKYSPMEITGGFQGGELSYTDVRDFSNRWGVGQTRLFQGTGQLMKDTPIQIGDGVTETHFKAAGQSFELPPVLGDDQINWRVSEGYEMFRLKFSPTDRIDLGAHPITTATRQKFVIDDASVVPAFFGTISTTLKGWEVVWKNVVPCSQAVFDECYVVDAKDSSLNLCTIQDSKSITHALKIDTGGSFTNGSFTKGDEGFAVRIDGTGEVDLRGTTFLGYTTELEISATTGTVTVYASQDLDYVSAGATVDIINGVSLVFSGIQNGSKVYIFDSNLSRSDPNYQKAGGLVTAGTFEYIYEYTAGLKIDVRIVSLQNQITEFDYDLTDQNLVIPIRNQTDRVYANN